MSGFPCLLSRYLISVALLCTCVLLSIPGAREISIYNTIISNPCWEPRHMIYSILHGWPININVFKTSLVNVIKPISGKIYNVSRTSFFKVYIKMRTRSIFSSHDILLCTDMLLYILSTCFS